MASTVAVSTGRRADLAWPSQHLPVDAIGILPASLGLTDSEVSGQLDVRVAGAAGCRQVLPVDSGRWVARTPNVMAAVTILAQGRLPVAATACRGMDALAVGLGRLLVAVLALNRGYDGAIVARHLVGGLFRGMALRAVHWGMDRGSQRLGYHGGFGRSRIGGLDHHGGVCLDFWALFGLTGVVAAPHQRDGHG